MARWLRIFLFFTSCLSINTVLSQQYDYIQYTVKDGLPTNYVYGVVEDDDGYIWVYTENGIAKFDGYEFKTYSTKDGLPGNDIHTCLKDKYGRIWLEIYKNKPAVYIQNDSFYVVTKETLRSMSINDGIISCYTSDGIKIQFRKDTIERISNRFLESSLIKSFPEFFTLDSTYLDMGSLEENHLIFEKEDKYWSKRADTIDVYIKNHDNSRFFFKKDNGEYIKYQYPYSDNRWSKFHKIPRKNAKIHFDINNAGSKLNKATIIDFDREITQTIPLTQIEQYQTKLHRHTILDQSVILSFPNMHLEYDFDGNLIEFLSLEQLAKQYFILGTYRDSKENIWTYSIYL